MAAGDPPFVLDGRRRQGACARAGVIPVYQHLPVGIDPGVPRQAFLPVPVAARCSFIGAHEDQASIDAVLEELARAAPGSGDCGSASP